jgi:murein DD-endopeptidase MepM/ murein hydrolase activator NlpD
MASRDWELHLHPRDPRGKIRSLRLSPARVRRVFVLILLLVAWCAAGIAAAPRAIRTGRSQNDYRAGVALRQELGDRTEALVARLGQLAERGRELRDRLERVERLYGTFPPGAEGEPANRAAALPDATIFARRIADGRRAAGELENDLERVEASIGRISAHERAAPEVAATLPVRSPLGSDDVVLSSGFGPRRSPYTRELEFHSGIDFAAPRGTPVLAPADGVVAWTGVMSANPRSDWWRLGRTIVVRHGDRIRTLYGHLDAIEVRPGQKVRVGARLGRVGETGWTTAPHLHYEIRRLENGEWAPADPRQFLLALPAPDTRGLPESREGGAPLPAPLPRAFLR